jgi:restriction endonuclease S subunit
MISDSYSWREVTLGDLADFINGDRGKNYPGVADRVEFGAPFINTGHILPSGRLSNKDMDYITREKFNQLGSGKVRPGDIVYCLRGSTIGKTARNHFQEGAIASSLVIIRAKQGVNQDYLYYFLTSPKGQQLAKENDNGSAQPNLSAKLLSKYPLLAPSYGQQSKIASFLNAIDNKIEVNTQTNQTLEAMAQAIFKSWFVDFDPVRAKQTVLEAGGSKEEAELAAMAVISGKTPVEIVALKTQAQAQALSADAQKGTNVTTGKMPGEIYAELASTAAQFPSKLVDATPGTINGAGAGCTGTTCEQMLIPEGWIIQETQKLFEVKDGTHDSPKKSNSGHYLVTSKHITNGRIDTSNAYFISEDDYQKVNQRSKVDTLDILLTMIGTVGEIVAVYDNPVEFAIKNVGLFKTSQYPELVWLFFLHLQSFGMKQYLEARMAGTTQQYLTLKVLRSIPVLVPSDNVLAKFNELVSPIMSKIHDANEESKSLAHLRDTLLPKLLSGELQLFETERLLAEVN